MKQISGINIKNIKKYFSELVIVEGKKDEKALSELGFKRIFVLAGKPFYSCIEKIEEQVLGLDCRVCILTDLDKKGRKLYYLIKKELSRRNVKFDDSLRGVLIKEKVSHVEGLMSFINKTRRNEKVLVI